MGKLITVTEASHRFGVTLQTLRNWTKGGHIKVKKIGHSKYLDEETVNALQDSAEDIEKAKRYLERIREEHEKELEFRRTVRTEETTRKRYMDVMTGAALKSGFFKSVVSLMRSFGSLNHREAEILTEFLEGETVGYMSEQNYITKQRVCQIINKAIRKSGDLAGIEKKIEELTALRAENNALREHLTELEEKLLNYENPKSFDDAEAEAYKKLAQLLSTDVRDFDFSARALNCMRSADIETVGDLASSVKQNLMKIRNFGKKTFWELEEFLDSYNLSFGTDVKEIYKKAAIYN